MNVLFSELCKKDVINCSDGSVLGYVTDIEINIENCSITAIILDSQKGLSLKKEHIRIPWDKIEKIGIDVIIVNFCLPPCHDKCEKKGIKKLFG